MKRTSACICGFLLAVAFVSATAVSCSSPSGSTNDRAPVQQGDPVKIGVYMPSSGPLAGLAKLQAEGVRAAVQMEGFTGTQPVKLVFHDQGDSPREFVKMLEGLKEPDQVSAIIACISAGTASAAADVLRERSIPLVVTSPRTAGSMPGGDEPLVRICTTLEDQALAAARFAASTFKARRFGMILAVDDATCVRLASLFSSDVVKQGGSIVDVAYVKKNQDPSSDLTHLVGEKPDAIYVPFSSATSLALIAKARTVEKEMPIIVSNVQPEEILLSGAGRSLEGVYVLTDFHEQAVTSSRGRRFIEFFHKNLKKRGYLGSSIATGADAYFLAVQMSPRTQNKGGQAGMVQGGQWNSPMLGIQGATPSGALRHQLCVGRIQKGFMRGATLKYIGQVGLPGLDPQVDVRAQ